MPDRRLGTSRRREVAVLIFLTPRRMEVAVPRRSIPPGLWHTIQCTRCVSTRVGRPAPAGLFRTYRPL